MFHSKMKTELASRFENGIYEHGRGHSAPMGWIHDSAALGPVGKNQVEVGDENSGRDSCFFFFLWNWEGIHWVVRYCLKWAKLAWSFAFRNFFWALCDQTSACVGQGIHYKRNHRKTVHQSACVWGWKPKNPGLHFLRSFFFSCNDDWVKPHHITLANVRSKDSINLFGSKKWFDLHRQSGQ